MTLAFLACAERGRLEPQTLLLVRSIRRWGGRFRDAPVWTFQPRAGTEVSGATAAALRDLSVTHVTERLNERFPDYGIANKVFACAWAEEHVPADVLVFLDSDSVLLGEPAALDLPPGTDAAVRPVDRKHQGSTGPSDPHDAFWRAAYTATGVRGEPSVRTTVDDEEIRAYFNAGLVAARRDAGVMTRWREHFLRLMDASLVPPHGRITFLDQVALATALADTMPRVRIPDATHNYPLPLRPILPRALRETPLDAMVHVHYHKWFQRPGFLREISPPLDPRAERFRWLEERLPLEPTIDDPLRW